MNGNISIKDSLVEGNGSDIADCPGIALHTSGFGEEKWQHVLPEKNMAYLKIQTLRLSAFMIRISSSSTCCSDSIKKSVDSSGVLMLAGTWSLAGRVLLVTAGKGT
jgi:hypothetical protein